MSSIMLGDVVVCVAFNDGGPYFVPESDFCRMMNERHPDGAGRVCNTHHIMGYLHLTKLLEETPDDIAKVEYLMRDLNQNWARWCPIGEYYEDYPEGDTPHAFALMKLDAVDLMIDGFGPNMFDGVESAELERYFRHRATAYAGWITTKVKAPELAQPAGQQKKPWLL